MKVINNLENVKINLFKKINILYLLIIIIIFFLDRVSKMKVINEFNEKTYFINEFLNIDLIWNTGIGFGLFSTDADIIYFLINFLIVAIVFILIYFLIQSQYIDKLVYSMLIGGALGNLYDRLSYKAVPDFLDLHYSNFHWFTFNVADIYITTGILIFILKSFFERKVK